MTNSFWREVLDHIPGLVFLFRVDENEDAHLIFVNSQIQHMLGYTPEEYVLASESSDSNVQAEVMALVEKIADLSHNGSSDAEPICRLHSKRAADYSFSFEFRIFSVKSSPLPFIAVSLEPLKKDPAVAGSSSALPEGKEGGGDAASGQLYFVTESPLMKALMQKVDAVTDQHVHLLFRGDRSTGKRTLANQVLKAEGFSGAKTVDWDVGSMSPAEQNEAVEALCGTAGKANTGDDRICLLIVEISKLTGPNQEKLLDWMQVMTGAGKKVRILATTRTLLEEQMKRGKFSMELYYYISFESILLPPLSQRKEDIRALAESWIPNAAQALGLGEMKIEEPVMERLLHHDWPGNFDEFYRVLRSSLLRSDQGVFRLIMDPSASAGIRASSEKTGGEALQEIVTFDEMNRQYLEQVLNKTDGKIYGRDGAAYVLGMKPTTLQSKLKKLGVR